MAIPRRQILEHYAKRGFTELGPQQLVEKVASIAKQSGFTGERAALTAVVRCDLNGYSDWCSKQKENLRARVELLDEYFTKTVVEIYQHNGVYFRDEGDCVVALFSDYFWPNALSNVKSFCRRVSEKKWLYRL